MTTIKGAWYLLVHSESADQILVSDVTGTDEPEWVDIKEDDEGEYIEFRGDKFYLERESY